MATIVFYDPSFFEDWAKFRHQLLICSLDPCLLLEVRRVWYHIEGLITPKENNSRAVLKGDGHRVEPQFRPAYRWLMGQINKRLKRYAGGYPVWVWYSPKPGLRSVTRLPI